MTWTTNKWDDRFSVFWGVHHSSQMSSFANIPSLEGREGLLLLSYCCNIGLKGKTFEKKECFVRSVRLGFYMHAENADEGQCNSNAMHKFDCAEGVLVFLSLCCLLARTPPLFNLCGTFPFLNKV